MMICDSVQTVISESVVPHLQSIQHADSSEYLHTFVAVYQDYYNQIQAAFGSSCEFGSVQWKESIDMLFKDIAVYITPALNEVSSFCTNSSIELFESFFLCMFLSAHYISRKSNDLSK